MTNYDDESEIGLAEWTLQRPFFRGILVSCVLALLSCVISLPILLVVYRQSIYNHFVYKDCTRTIQFIGTTEGNRNFTVKANSIEYNGADGYGTPPSMTFIEVGTGKTMKFFNPPPYQVLDLSCPRKD